MIVGFKIEVRETNPEQKNHKNDGIVKCQNEKKTLLHVVFWRQHNFASKEDLSLSLSHSLSLSLSLSSARQRLRFQR